MIEIQSTLIISTSLRSIFHYLEVILEVPISFLLYLYENCLFISTFPSRFFRYLNVKFKSQNVNLLYISIVYLDLWKFWKRLSDMTRQVWKITCTVTHYNRVNKAIWCRKRMSLFTKVLFVNESSHLTLNICVIIN